MVTPGRDCRIERRDGVDALVLEGAWRLSRARELDAGLAALGPALGRVARLDGAALADLDTGGALLVLARLRSAGIDAAALPRDGLSPSHARIVELVADRIGAAGAPAAARGPDLLHRIGESAVSFGRLLAGHVAFLGRTASELSRAAVRPGALRWRELGAQLGQAGVDAIPVVALVTFLIGVVFAYLLGLQASQYGANIFVVDGVALGMTREFSPLIVATIVAGRSGAAFTAQLGTMKLTEEIDAIRTLGLSAEQVLVVPRVLALVVALPLLVFVGDLAGLAGAMLVAQAMLDVTPYTFVDRLQAALAPLHYLIGLGKAPVFALAIAVIGCRMGFDVARDTRSIGMNTTSTVVQGIVAVIVLDAVFAVLFQAIGW
ncbi:MAG TPA: ABC transporter permease [Burkholderiaceae bacterium]|nr:ABC transporter permease [Burkholderiaceae bacterium]